MTPELKARLEREIGLRGSLYEFLRMSWSHIEPGVPFQDNWHLRVVCVYLEKVFRRDIRRLIINQPPGTTKSTVVSVAYNVWSWLRDPGRRILVTSFDMTLTVRDARRVLNLINSEWFQERWPELQIEGDAIADFGTSAGGQRFSTSLGGRVLGRHFDDHVIDDPIKPAEMSKVTLLEAQTYFAETLSSRFRKPSDGAQILVMQRLHEDDPAGHLERQGGWTVVRLPMEFEPGTDACPEDPRTEAGELLWPSRIPAETVAEKKKEMGSIVYAAQMQQRPVPEGGAIFRREWFQHYTAPPAKFDTVIQSWDCAFKDDSDSDFVVGQVWGRKGGEYWLLDQFRARVGLPGTVLAIKNLSRKWPKAVKKLIENKANGPAVEQSLRKQVSGIIMVNPEGGKTSRANAVTPLYEAGNVYHPDPTICPWVGDFETELLRFPMGSNDDQVDCMTQALLHLYSRRAVYAEAMRNLSTGKVNIL